MESCSASDSRLRICIFSAPLYQTIPELQYSLHWMHKAGIMEKTNQVEVYIMFSDEERCIYRKNPLANVICQLRFPEILSIGANLPVDFQEAIRSDYPRYSARKEVPAPKLTGTPGNLNFQKQEPVTNYQFSSADNLWTVNLTGKFISLSCAEYSCWEEFAARLDKPLAAFIQLYKPAFFERVDLRYINFISRRDLHLEGIPFRDLIQPCYAGLLIEDDVAESSVLRSSVDTELKIRGGCNAKIHAGPGITKKQGKPDPEVKFVFDQDLYMTGNIPVNMSAGALETLHRQAHSIFCGAITKQLHEAMQPE